MRFDAGTFVYFAGSYSLTLFGVIPMLPNLDIPRAILLCVAGGLIGITTDQHFKNRETYKK